MKKVNVSRARRILVLAAVLFLLSVGVGYFWACQDRALRSVNVDDSCDETVWAGKEKLGNPHPPRPSYEPPEKELDSIPPEGVVRPAEFQPQDGTIIAVLDHGDDYIEMWAQMTAAYSATAHTWIIIEPQLERDFELILGEYGVEPGTYTFLNYPLDSIWIRDYGPEFVVDRQGKRHILDGHFIGLVTDWMRDDSVPILVANDDWINEDGSPMPFHSHENPMSGGNLMTDGAGTCFASSVIYGGEMPTNWTREQVDEFMEQYFGCKQLIVLHPICLDETGHIDIFAKIIGPNEIVLGQFSKETTFDGRRYTRETGHCENHRPNDYGDMEKNYEILRDARNMKGEPFTIRRIPMPEPFRFDGNWIYRSYINAELVNDRLVMPVYRERQQHEPLAGLLNMERKAVDAYLDLRPDLHIVKIQADHLVKFGGAIHCISHEVPAEKARPRPPIDFDYDDSED